jgi:type-F conjugative transfer system pilin assembly protein TrbC
MKYFSTIKIILIFCILSFSISHTNADSTHNLKFLKQYFNQYKNFFQSSKNKNNLNSSNANLYIFVSSSMSEELLKNYAKEAKDYNAILVFNGLPDNSFKKLKKLIEKLSDFNKIKFAAVIDDELFRKFNINLVPSFVLSEEDIFSAKVLFDKLDGNIGVKRALNIFNKGGDLKSLAFNYLKQKK